MTMRRRLPAALTATFLGVVGGPACAHAILVDSSPKPGGTLPAGHQTLHFVYNSRIDHRRSRLTLTGPSGKPTVLAQSPGSASNALDARADLIPGDYTLRWQALALDGHITRGDVPFTATGARAPR